MKFNVKYAAIAALICLIGILAISALINIAKCNIVQAGFESLGIVTSAFLLGGLLTADD